MTLQKHSAAEADCYFVLTVCVCKAIASTISSSHSLRLFPMLCGGLGYPLPLVTTIPSRCPPLPPPPPPPPSSLPLLSPCPSPLPPPPFPHPHPASFGRRAQIGRLSTVIRRRELVRLPFHFGLPGVFILLYVPSNTKSYAHFAQQIELLLVIGWRGVLP